jgi:hypothetical protein
VFSTKRPCQLVLDSQLTSTSRRWPDLDWPHSGLTTALNATKPLYRSESRVEPTVLSTTRIYVRILARSTGARAAMLGT